MTEALAINGVSIDPSLVVQRLEKVFPEYHDFTEWKKDRVNIKDIMWMPTHVDEIPEVVDQLEITNGDVFIDMGCGDGRIPAGITLLADLAGCKIKCSGYEKRPTLIRYARERLRTLGLEGRVGIKYKDILRDNLRELERVTKVYFYLFGDMNLDISTDLEKYLPNGAMVLSKSFSMPRSWEKYRKPYRGIPSDRYHKYRIIK